MTRDVRALSQSSRAAISWGDKLHGKAGQVVTNVGEKWAAKDVKEKRSAAERAWRNRNWTMPVVPSESF